MLLPPEQSFFLEKNSSKKDLIEASSSGRSKIVFALLDEVIAVHMRLTFIYVRGSGLKKPFSRFIREFLFWSGRSLEL